MKKRVLSGLLAIALIFGSAAALPEGVFETSSTIRASADSYVSGDLLYEYELSENGKFVMITKYLDKTSTTCPIPETIDGKPVEIIAHAAFRDHTELKKVVFPKSLRGIANVAFKGCTSLRELDLPETLTQISESAFEGCTDLESVTIPKGVKTIGKNAFANCECLDSVTIQDGVGGIDVGAFSGCTWLSNITIPGSVKTIAVNAFNKCINLERVTISDGVEFIGAYAFTGCPGLSRLVIPQSVKTIGKDTTAYPYPEDNPICDKDKCSIACYPGSNALTYAAFNGYKIEYISGDYIYKELKDETVEITGYLGKDKILTIPSELAEKKVSGIGNGAFANMSDLTSVIIQNGVTSIGGCAFENCRSLTSITIPNSVTSIGGDAFCDCSSLASVTIQNGVTSIGYNAFSGTKWLENQQKKNPLVVVNGILIDGTKCSGNVTIPKSVTSIGSGAFSRCSSLTSVTIPNSVTSIGDCAFQYCSSLTSVTIPSSVTSIGYSAFENCSSLTSITIPDSVTSIGYAMFRFCSSLTSVTIPSSVTSISGYAFYGTKWLENQQKKNPLVVVNGILIDGTICSDGEVTIPSSVKSISDYAFYNCSLTSVTIPKSVETIGVAAFGYKEYRYYDNWGFEQLDIYKASIKINCYKGTAGEKYAKDNNFKYELIDCSHTYKTTIVKPTCTTAGYTLHKCSKCGYEYKDNEKNALGHKWGNWATTKKATETETGIKVRTCQRCDDIETETIPKVTHVHKYKSSITKQPTCTETGVRTYTCTTCGYTYTEEIAMTAHKWGAWVVTKPASKTSTGVRVHTCLVCDKTEKEIIPKTSQKRFAGDNRFSTAAAISKASYPNGADTVILAFGLNYADALAGVPLAEKLNAPILLTHTKTLPDETLAEIKRLGAKKVIILGGEGAITKNVVKTLEANGLKTKRIAGQSRFGTATAIAAELNKAPEELFFVYGLNSADALSVGGVAAAKGAPIIYLTTDGKLNADTEAYLKSVKGKVKNAYIIGGDGVISNAMMKNVATALGLTVNKTVIRVAGKNRYETCVAVNKKFKSVLSSDGICVAKGLDFPDALAGGVFAAKTRQALFLADGKKLQDVQSSYLKGKNASKITVFGGVGAVPDDLVKLIAEASV